MLFSNQGAHLSLTSLCVYMYMFGLGWNGMCEWRCCFLSFYLCDAWEQMLEAKMLQAQRDVIKLARERDAAVEIKDAAVEDAVKTATIQVIPLGLTRMKILGSGKNTLLHIAYYFLKMNR